MQAEMLDSTISCIPSTLNFVCDVDGVHTEIPIPSSAWDFENETVWLTQAQLAELYKVTVPAVSKQIQNVFEDEELKEDSVISKIKIVQTEGNREVSRRVMHYNLEMLIALGYRIRSKVATKFRQWATQHLKELMTKGRTDIETQVQSVMIPNFCNPAEAARAWADLYEKNQATELRALTAEAELISEKEYSLNTLQNKARELLSHFATKLMKRPIPLPNGATYPDSFGRLQPSISTYYEKDVVDAVRDWVVENPDKFARIGGKRDPLRDEW